MKLKTGWAKNIETPRADQIEAVLQKMPGGPDSFVILEEDASRFIQAHGSSDSGFRLEYWEKGRGYVCQPDPGLDQVIQAFQSYARADEWWHVALAWAVFQDIDTGRDKGNVPGGEAAKITKKRPRYTKKGLLRLALFAVLVLVGFFVIGGPLGFIYLLPSIVPLILLLTDLYTHRRNFSLPSLFFTIMVNLLIWAFIIGMLVYLVKYPPRDWPLLVATVPWLAIAGTEAFLWGQRIWFLYRLNKEGIETAPSGWRHENFAASAGLEGTRGVIIYSYADGQAGLVYSDLSGFLDWLGRPRKNVKKVIRYLPDRPHVHRLTRGKWRL